ncbi:MAG: hypothetical protein KJ666_11030 [Bacteroidetes bacterium]|nr:hypothetical protein [Bacteroidota bacterium]
MGLNIRSIISTLLFVAISFSVVPAQQKLTLNKITTQSETELVNLILSNLGVN